MRRNLDVSKTPFHLDSLHSRPLMHSIYLISILALAHLSLSASICYFPNGETSRDVPCSPSAAVTQCCGTRDACLSNGLCALTATNTTGDGYARGTCTDRSWSSPLCPQQCQLNQDTPSAAHSLAYDFRASGVQVWQCGSEGYARDAKFCCESEAESKRCCSTSSAVFTLKSASVGASTSVEVTTSSARVSSTGGASAAQTVSSSSVASATSSPDALVGELKKNYKKVGIGAGVGGAVVGCIVIALVVFCVRKRRKAKAGEVVVEENHGDTQKAYVVEENKSPAELLTTERRAELAPNPLPVWELPGHEARTPRI